jgi:hypothetical protein
VKLKDGQTSAAKPIDDIDRVIEALDLQETLSGYIDGQST